MARIHDLASRGTASRPSRMRASLCAIALVWIAGAAVAQQAQSLGMTASAGELTITNVTRGGRAVLAGMSIRAEGGGVRRLRRFAEVLTDADSDGRITYVPDGKVPLRSIWEVVDLQTGATATAGGPQLSSFLKPFPENALKKDAGDLVTAFTAGGVEVEVVVVRPRDGAWRAHAYEGGPGDGDGVVNGMIAIAFESATPLIAEFSKAPKQLRKNDVVVLIDVRRLRLATTTIVN
jgi:hypothetical protein